MLAGFRRKSIIATVVSIAVLACMGSIFLFDLVVLRTDRLVDTMVYSIYQNDGQMPQDKKSLEKLKQAQIDRGLNPIVSADTPYATRYFTVFEIGGSQDADVSHIASVSKADAMSMAQQATSGADSKGWIGNYRYGVFDKGAGKLAVFIDANSFRVKDSAVFSGSVALLIMFSLTLVLLNLFYNAHATKPVQDSFERQKRFISNASHELKTPLTLIMTDADLAAMELGECEYLDDIKTECRDMSDLITQMVVLSRMDEDAHPLDMTCVNVSACVEGIMHSWRAAAQTKGLTVKVEAERVVYAKADQAALKQILAILMDNAVKYCDKGGTITVHVSGQDRKNPYVCIENSYAKAKDVDTSRLFERFYRADAERAEKIGHGIGLALAKETAESLGATIGASTKLDPAAIAFTLTLKGC